MEKTAEELQKELADSKAKAEENIKALQQKLTDKDLEIKKTQADIEDLKKKGSEDSETDKKLETLGSMVKDLTAQIGSLNTEKQKEELAKKFPDILPDLLLGKSPEEAELIAEKQRKITMQNYDQKPSAHGPVYKDRNEADEAIERIKKDPKLSTVDKLTKVREIKLKKDEI